MFKQFYLILILLTTTYAIIPTSINPQLKLKSRSNLKLGEATSSVKPCEKSDTKYFDTVVEQQESIHPRTSPKKLSIFTTQKHVLSTTPAERSYGEIKALLGKVLEEIDEIERRSDSVPSSPSHNLKEQRKESIGTVRDASSVTDKESPTITPRTETMITTANKPNKKMKKNECTPEKDAAVGNKTPTAAHHEQSGDKKKGVKWGHWTDWSSCSVSCGKGRQIRWRHCVEHCDEAETEMEEKTCQLPACSPAKLFGVIKI